MTTPSNDQRSGEPSSDTIFPLIAEPKTGFGLLPLTESRSDHSHFSNTRYFVLLTGLLYLSSLITSVILSSKQLGLPTPALPSKNPFSIEVILVLFPLLASLYMFLQSQAGLSSFELMARSRIRSVVENCFMGIALVGMVGEMLPSPKRNFELPMPPSSDGSLWTDLAGAGATLATLFICQPAATFTNALDWDFIVYTVVIATASWILLFMRSIFSGLLEQRLLKLAGLRRDVRLLESDLRRLVVDPWTFPQTMRALHRRLSGDYDQNKHYLHQYVVAFGWRLCLSSLLAGFLVRILIFFDVAAPSGGWLLVAWAESTAFAVAEYLMIRRLRKGEFVLIVYGYLAIVATFGLGLVSELNAGNQWFILIFIPLVAVLWVWQLRTHCGFRADYPDDHAKLWDPEWRRTTASTLTTHYSWGNSADVASLRVAFGGLNATRWQGVSGRRFEEYWLLNSLDPWRNKRFTWMLNRQLVKLISDRESKISEAEALESQIFSEMSRM